VESRRDRDKKGTAPEQDVIVNNRSLLIGTAGHFVAVTAEDAPAILGDDPSGDATKVLNDLCTAPRCDRLVLLYILKVIRERLPCDWWPVHESKEQAKRRRDDADVADRFAAIIREQYAFFLPGEEMTEDEQQTIKGQDLWAISHGGVAPYRLLLAVESFAEQLRSPDEFRRTAGLRPNQDDFDVISRCVFCTYVQRTTGEWHDREAAVLLTQVGNHKGDSRNATLDGVALRQWRAKNQERLQPLASWAVSLLESRSVG
jgi:hypothetical protein